MLFLRTIVKLAVAILVLQRHKGDPPSNKIQTSQFAKKMANSPPRFLWVRFRRIVALPVKPGSFKSGSNQFFLILAGQIPVVMFFSVFVSAKDFWDREKTNQEQKWGEASKFFKNGS